MKDKSYMKLESEIFSIYFLVGLLAIVFIGMATLLGGFFGFLLSTFTLLIISGTFKNSPF